MYGTYILLRVLASWHRSDDRHMTSRLFPLWLYPLCTMFDALVTLKNHQSHPQIENTPLYSLSPDAIGLNLVAMIVIGVAAYIFLIAFEGGSLNPLQSHLTKWRKQTNITYEFGPVDDDVQAEEDRINAMTTEHLKSETLVMQNVSKFYGPFQAVKNVSFTIKK